VLPRFNATMSPSDSRPGQLAVIYSHELLIPAQALGWGHLAGSLRFLDGSVDIRRPQPPRGVQPLPLLVAWRSGVRLHPFLKVGHSHLLGFNEAESGSLALRLTSSLSQASAGRSPVTPLSRLHGERAIAMVSPFHLTRSSRLLLTHKNEANCETKILLATDETRLEHG
jgi:hypothetical protein